MRGNATSLAEYLAGLPDERRSVVTKVRAAVRAAMPAGYKEGFAYGMICWSVPLERFPNTYNGQPLGYVSLAAQKSHYSLYLTSAYQDRVESAWLKAAFAKAGKRLDMGKSCLRFRRLDDLPLPIIAEFIRRTSVDALIAQYEAARAGGTCDQAHAAPLCPAGARN